jgi:hypothetical protein
MRLTVVRREAARVLIPSPASSESRCQRCLPESVVLIVEVGQMMHTAGPPEVRSRAINEAAPTARIAWSVALLIRRGVGFLAGVRSAIVVYRTTITSRAIRNARWLHAWLANVS